MDNATVLLIESLGTPVQEQISGIQHDATPTQIVTVTGQTYL